MEEEDHSLKRLVLLGIPLCAVIFLAHTFKTGEDNPLVYLIGALFGGAALFGFFRPDLVDFDGN